MIFLSLLFCAFAAHASSAGFDNWVQTQEKASAAWMLENISPAGSHAGAVIASPSHQDPDYYYHWIRDSALVMDSVLTLSEKSGLFPDWKKQFTDYVGFSALLQVTPTLAGLGEPRFNVDGSAYNGPWSRPQNDGPALRLITLFHGMNRLDPNQDEQLILFALQVAQTDIQYLLTHWQEPSFDIWEEIKGQHFYTHINQLGAMEAALQFARTANMPGTIPVAECEDLSQKLRAVLDQHWLADRKYFSITRDRIEGGETYKHTDLDTAAILGVLHAHLNGSTFTVQDERVISTAGQVENLFLKLYPINASAQAPAVGRYEGDIYYGGNPWYLTTAGMAEFHYRWALSLSKSPQSLLVTDLNLPVLKAALTAAGQTGIANSLKVPQKIPRRSLNYEVVLESLVEHGDQYLEQVRLYAGPDGHLSEQFSKTDGHPVSARDLTWSYAAFLTAAQARADVTHALSGSGIDQIISNRRLSDSL